MPALNALAAAAFDAQTRFADHVHFVHVYVIEPHPMRPDPSPYRGSVAEAQYSVRRQPRSHAERVDCARAVRSEVRGAQLMLVDDLQPGRANPLWCTYGTCPNCAFLVRRDGTLHTVQTWVNVAAMESAIRDLFRE